MKNRFLIYIMLFIVVFGCGKENENEILTTNNVEERVSTRSDEVIDFFLTINGKGKVVVSSETIGSEETSESRLFCVKNGEEIHLEAYDGIFMNWSGSSSSTEYIFNATPDCSVSANFGVPMTVEVTGSGCVIVNGKSYTNGVFYEVLEPNTEIDVRVNDNGFELYKLNLNGSDIISDVPGQFAVGDEVNIQAEFLAFTRYLVINEESSLTNDIYEIWLEGYESIDGYSVMPIMYTGGNCTYGGYVQHLGLNGFIRNTGYKSLYVEIDFDGNWENFVIPPDGVEYLNLMSYNYLEGRYVYLTIKINDKRY